MKLIKTLLLIAVAFFFTGCFDIEEEVTFNRNGSGDYRMAIDMGGMIDMLAMFSGDDEGEAKDSIMQSMDSTMMANKARLSEIPGITNVESYQEESQIVVTYSFDNVEALNQALAASEDDGEDQEMARENYFIFSKKNLERINIPLDAVQEMQEDPELKENMSMIKSFFGESTYKTVYHLPGKVKKVSNEDAVIEEDKRTVTMEVLLVDILEGNASVGNEIRFK